MELYLGMLWALIQAKTHEKNKQQQQQQTRRVKPKNKQIVPLPAQISHRETKNVLDDSE